MRSLLTTGTFLALIALTARSDADDSPWGPPRQTDNPAAAAWSVGKSGSSSTSAPVVSLSRPVPIRSGSAANDTAVRPASYQATAIARSNTDEVRYPDLVPLAPAPQGFPAAGTTALGASQFATPSNNAEDIPVQPRPVATPQLTSSYFGAPALVDPDCSCDSICGAPCGPCGPCGDGCLPRGRVWGSVEYLLWAVKGENVPPLLTTSVSGTGIGALGSPDTQVLFNKSDLPSNLRNGGRFTLGFWLPGIDDIGLETSYFFLGQRTNNFNASSTGLPVLARPYTDAATGIPTSVPVALPGMVGGSFGVLSTSYLWGIEANVRQKLWCCPCGYVDLLAGYRHLQLTDNINMSDIESFVGGPTFAIGDNFSTRNEFNGFNMGVDAQWYFWRKWFLGVTAKVAVGETRQIIGISGFGNPAGSYGLLAEPSNIGTFTRDRFGVLPSATVKLGYNFTPRLRVWVGYDFLYLNSVVRAGDQIDLVLNSTQLATGALGGGPARPGVPFTSTGFWAQGASFGLEYRW